VRLRLVPDGVLVHLGLQPGLWGDAGAERDRAHRAFSRVQGLLGPESVVTPVLGGGRSADDQVRLVPWGDAREPHRPAAPHADPVPGNTIIPVQTIKDQEIRVRPEQPEDQPTEPGLTVVAVRPGRRKSTGRQATKAAPPPWPGRLPRPAPALVLASPLPAVVLDDTGTPVGVSARLDLTGTPAALVVDRAQPVEISGWAGPWPVDERWWAPAEARRRARFQVSLTDGRALLLVLAGGHWAVEAIYD
jgi:protein ImuB